MGADRVGGQLRGDKECPFRGVTKSGRVWRKVPESDARSVATRVEIKARTRSVSCGVRRCVSQSQRRTTVSAGLHNGGSLLALRFRNGETSCLELYRNREIMKNTHFRVIYDRFD